MAEQKQTNWFSRLIDRPGRAVGRGLARWVLLPARRAAEAVLAVSLVWGLDFRRFVLVIVSLGTIAIVIAGIIGGRSAAAPGLEVGVPPLFAALLAWGLSERTRDNERAFQRGRRKADQDDRDAQRERAKHYENLAQVQ